VEGLGAASEEVAQEVADGLAAVAEVGGDPWGRPSGIGEGDHLDAVADLRREGLPPQGVEFVTGGVVEVDADHAEL
jgi:hypothetical protein